MSEDEWIARHVALMRTQRGHWCFVRGCTGSQPLMWVPTEAEAESEHKGRARGRAIDLPVRLPSILRPSVRGGMTRWDGSRAHVHWAETVRDG